MVFLVRMKDKMNLKKLVIKGISYSQTQSGAYALVLNEVGGIRTLPIIIGAFEAQSIAIALEKEIKPPRPLTHDLFKTFADKYFITIKQVIIHKLVDGVFFSSLISECDGVEEVIDTRTSDAIALAVRFDAPIYTYEDILEKAGIFLEIDEESAIEDTELEAEEILSELAPEKPKDEFHSKSLKVLYKELDAAVSNENYELAAKIRDEISKRS